MKTLLIDVGNSRIKWCWCEGARLGRVRAQAWTARNMAAVARRVFRDASSCAGVLVGSVAGPPVNRALRRAARAAKAPAPQFVRSTASCAGLSNGYHVPSQLGVDRWLAMIGARASLPRRALCIVTVGTATTVDVIDARGLHHGGWIVPGPQLMVEALLTRTALIRGRAKLRGRGASPGLARDTRAAIGSGSVQAIAAIAIHAQQLARGLLKTPVQLLLSGGGAAVTARALALRPGRAALPLAATDLVLTGLSVLAAQSKR